MAALINTVLCSSFVSAQLTSVILSVKWAFSLQEMVKALKHIFLLIKITSHLHNGVQVGVKWSSSILPACKMPQLEAF